MSSETVKALFLQALDVEIERRGAFLDEQCGGDAGLCADVLELLDFDAKAENTPDFLLGPVAGEEGLSRSRHSLAAIAWCDCSARGAWARSMRLNRIIPAARWRSR